MMLISELQAGFERFEPPMAALPLLEITLTVSVSAFLLTLFERLTSNCPQKQSPAKVSAAA